MRIEGYGKRYGDREVNPGQLWFPRFHDAEGAPALDDLDSAKDLQTERQALAREQPATAAPLAAANRCAAWDPPYYGTDIPGESAIQLVVE